MKTQSALVATAAALVAATLGADAPGAAESSTVLTPQAQQEIAQVEVEIDRIEAQTIERLAKLPDNQVQQVELLGKLILYDKQLSVYRNEACTFCHMPETGFTGPVSELNRITAAYPGSLRTRFCDQGIGISAEHLPFIFERFYRAAPSSNGENHSGGLGLAIAQAVARAQGGSIECQSSPRVGSTFTLLLPMKTSPEIPLPVKVNRN